MKNEVVIDGELRQLRERVMVLTTMYRILCHTQEPNGTWDWFLKREIEEIEEVISSMKRKIAAVEGDNRALIPVEWAHAVLIIADNPIFGEEVRR